MKIAVVGDRNFDLKYGELLHGPVGALLDALPTTSILSILTGDATGVDAWARSQRIGVGRHVIVYCASDDRCALLTSEGYACISVSDWKRNGKAAGPMRNARVIADADRVILVDGGGPGSADVARKCAKVPEKPFAHLKLTGCNCLSAEARCVACLFTGTIVTHGGVPFADVDLGWWHK